MLLLIQLWQWVVGPCVFGHEPRVYERTEDGILVLVCPRCRDTRVVHFAAKMKAGH